MHITHPSRILRRALTTAIFAAASLLATLALFSSNALAQAWPAKPVTIISPYPAGGITDQIGCTQPIWPPLVPGRRTGVAV